jgi:hypothetical protein
MTSKKKRIYSYPVDCGYHIYTANVIVERDTWNRLDSCNAMHWSRPTWRKPGEYREDMYFLVSYGVPIMQVVHRAYEMGYDKYILKVNEEHWNCSNSTRRHVGRFLRRYNLPVGYGDLKVLMNKCERENSFSTVLTLCKGMCDVFVWTETPDDMREIFDVYTPFWQVV